MRLEGERDYHKYWIKKKKKIREKKIHRSG